MSIFPRQLVRRRRDGRYDLAFDKVERDVLRTYLDQLRDLLLSDDDLLRRLFPPAFADDPEKDADYQELMKGDLIESRFAAMEVMESTLDQDTVDEATLTRWMQSVNSLRLVVGTRLDVSETPERVSRDDPDYGLHVLYEELGWILSHIVHALADALPEPPDEPPAP